MQHSQSPNAPAIRHPLDERMPALLRSGRPLRAIFNSLPSPAIVEMCAYAGFDFVLIDNEHGSAGHDMTEHMLRAARAAGIPPVVRCLRQDIARVLDMGASGVQIPMVESAAEARELVQQVRYPGAGRRGSAFSPRAAGYGAFPGADHVRRSNEGVALIVMIETEQAAAEAAAIAAVPGVDAVFVGPNDLSHSMGHGADWKCSEVDAVIARALRAIADAGGCAGIIAMNAEDEARYAAHGARFFATVVSSVVTQALRHAARPGEPPLAPSY